MREKAAPSLRFNYLIKKSVGEIMETLKLLRSGDVLMECHFAFGGVAFEIWNFFFDHQHFLASEGFKFKF